MERVDPTTEAEKQSNRPKSNILGLFCVGIALLTLYFWQQNRINVWQSEADIHAATLFQRQMDLIDRIGKNGFDDEIVSMVSFLVEIAIRSAEYHLASRPTFADGTKLAVTVGTTQDGLDRLKRIRSTITSERVEAKQYRPTPEPAQQSQATSKTAEQMRIQREETRRWEVEQWKIHSDNLVGKINSNEADIFLHRIWRENAVKLLEQAPRGADKDALLVALQNQFMRMPDVVRP